MSTSNLDVEKDFLSNVDYLKSLVKEVKSKTSSDYDSNLIYEVTYADMYVTDLLSRVKNPKLAENINDIKIALDLIISDIPDSCVEEARSKSDYTKILKAKYNNLDDGSFEEEVAYSSIEESNVIKEYLKKRTPSILTVFVLLLINTMGIQNFVSEIVDGLGLLFGMEASTTVIETNSAFSAVSSITNTIISCLIMFLIVALILGAVVDLLYLMMPALRNIIDNGKEESRFVSIYAKSAIEEVDGQLIKYKKIKSYDRVKRNKYWLQSMIDTLTSLQQSGKQIDENFAKSLVDLKCDLETCKEHSKEWYSLVAKIEFMHDRYIRSMEGIVV